MRLPSCLPSCCWRLSPGIGPPGRGLPRRPGPPGKQVKDDQLNGNSPSNRPELYSTNPPLQNLVVCFFTCCIEGQLVDCRLCCQEVGNERFVYIKRSPPHPHHNHCPQGWQCHGLVKGCEGTWVFRLKFNVKREYQTCTKFQTHILEYLESLRPLSGADNNDIIGDGPEVLWPLDRLPTGNIRRLEHWAAPRSHLPLDVFAVGDDAALPLLAVEPEEKATFPNTSVFGLVFSFHFPKQNWSFKSKPVIRGNDEPVLQEFPLVGSGQQSPGAAVASQMKIPMLGLKAPPKTATTSEQGSLRA